ncbi:hypothetical protein Tco_0042937, partial [Tanacetum coccineum]
GSHSSSSSTHQSSSVHHGVATEHSFEVNPFSATEHEKTSNLLLLKTAGFKPCKMKSMKLID